MPAKTLREWRQEKKLTQVQLAVLAGVALSTITDLETGRHSPSIQSAMKIAKALSLTLNDIIWTSENDNQ